MILFWVLVGVLLFLVTFALTWPLRYYRYYFSMLIVFFPTAVLVLYFFYGNSQQLKNYYSDLHKQQLVKQELAKFSGSQAVIDKLKQTLKQHPESAQGWYLLGRLYDVSGDYHQATIALAQAYVLAPNHFNYALEYLQSIYLQNNQKLTVTGKQLLDKLTTQYPDKPEVINFIAIDAYQHQDFKKAISNWQRLLATVPQDSAAQRDLLAAIARAQLKLNPAKH